MKPNVPLTILLVEDHDDTREAMKGWFEMEGHTVLTANNKETGLAIGRKQPFDVLICDLQLPDGDGRQLMKQLSAKRPILGIASSGHCAPSDIASSRAAGFVEHLAKPYAVEEMEAALARIQKELQSRKKG